MKFSIVRTDKQKAQHLTVKPVEWFMERIQTDTKGGTIARLRDFIASWGSADGYEQAADVATIYPSVELEKTPNGNLDIICFNSLIVLHVGSLLRKDDLEAVKEAAKMLPMTLAAFVGADGRSVEVLVAAAPGDPDALPQTEQEMDDFCTKAYEVAYGVYSGILPFPIERQFPSARTNFLMPLDPAPYYNPHPSSLSPHPASFSPHTSSLFSQTSKSSSPDFSLYTVYEQQYQKAAEEAYAETEGIIESQWYEAYITELTRRLCQAGMPEEEAFLHIRNHHVYKKIYNENTIRAIVSAVFSEEKPGRQQIDQMVSAETQRLIHFLTTRYQFRHNTVMGYTEYRPNNTWTQDWQPCDENVTNGMTIEARLANLDVRDKDVRRYVHSNMVRRCDPIDDYFSNLSGQWDGKTDHIALLARCVPCDLPQWQQWFRKWFLSMVAQWLLPRQEYGNSVVPLLISPQGDGKTTFCRMILPKELHWGFLESLDVSEKRQTLQAMHNFLLINLDEFNQISPKLQEGFLKNVIQLPSVKIKRPYGKHVEEFKRYASFIATTNEGSVLSDPTGNRRFICVQLTGPIDTTYRPNYRALYAQASTLILHHKEQWWFTPDEVKAIIRHNRHFEVVPPAVHYFNEYYTPVDDESDGQWLSPTAIYDHLRSIAGSSLRANGVATFGRYLNNIPTLRQKRVTAGKLYLVREK